MLFVTTFLLKNVSLKSRVKIKKYNYEKLKKTPKFKIK